MFIHTLKREQERVVSRIRNYCNSVSCSERSLLVSSCNWKIKGHEREAKVDVHTMAGAVPLLERNSC